METPPSASFPGPPPAPAPPPPPFGSPRPRQLRRRPDEGPLGGVCAGLAAYFNVDVVLVRIAAVVLAFSGPGLIAYVLAWIFVPVDEHPGEPPQARSGDRSDRGVQILGIVLLAIAVSVLWGDWWAPARGWMLPIGLMALGAWLLLRREPSDDAGPEVPTVVDTGTTPPLSPTAGDATLTGLDLQIAPEPPGGAASPPAPRGLGEPPERPARHGTSHRRRMLGPIVMGVLLLWTGIGWLAGVSLETGLAVGLCIVGVGFVLGAFVGGSWGLIVPAVAIGGALIVASLVDIPLSGPVGDRTWRPVAASAIEDHYELSVGEGTLDLTAVPLDDRLSIAVTVGIGHLVVEVPDGVALDIVADVGAGETALLGYHDSGVGVSTERSFRGSGTGAIELDLEVGLGQIEVRRQAVDLRSTTTSLR